MRPVTSGTIIFEDFDSLDEFVSNEGVVITAIIAGEIHAMVCWRYRNPEDAEFRGKTPETCEIIGVITCSLGRTLLYSQLEKIRPQQLLYCDTDAVFYIERVGEIGDDVYRPVLGDGLGQLSDEIANKFGPTAYIAEFVCSGPKAYAFTVKYHDDARKSNQVVKFKGYRVNRLAALTFDRVKQIVLGSTEGAAESRPYRVQTQMDIHRDKYFNVTSAPATKTFQFTFAKRVCVGDNAFVRGTTTAATNQAITSIDTIPFGYRAP